MTLQESEPKIQSKFLGQKLKCSKILVVHLKILIELHKLLPQINEAAGNCQADLVFSDCYYCDKVEVACLNNKYCNSAK